MQQFPITRTKMCLLFFHCLHQLQSHHYSTPAASQVLDFAAKFRLAVDCYILRKPVVYPVATLSIPAGDGFVDADKIQWEKIGFPVAIKCVHEPINKQPPVSFGAQTLGPHIGLSTKSNGRPT